MSNGTSMRVLKKSWPLAIAGIVGLAAGAGLVMVDAPRDASAGPVETVDPVVKEVVDPVCQDVAVELRSMLNDMTFEVAIPYSDVVMVLVNQLQYGAVASEIDGATAMLSDITTETDNLTARVEGIDADYEACVAGVS